MNNSKVLVWNIEGKKCRDWDCEGGGGRFISPNMLVFLLPPPRTLVFQSNSLIPDKFVILGTNLTLNVLLFYIVGHRLYDILNKIIIMKPTFRLLLGYSYHWYWLSYSLACISIYPINAQGIHVPLFFGTFFFVMAATVVVASSVDRRCSSFKIKGGVWFFETQRLLK